MNRCATCCLSVLMVAVVGIFVAGLPSRGASADEKKRDEKKKSAPAKPAAKGAKRIFEIKVDDITLKVPEGWEQEDVTSNLRKAQFVIAKAEGDSEPGELVVSFFGGGGGGVEANVQRWIKQFDAKDRKSKVTQGKSSQGDYAFADISGTYNKPIGSPIRQETKASPGSRMLGVVLTVKGKGNYFLKLTGSEKTVAAAAEAFRTSFGADPKSEKEMKLEGEKKDEKEKAPSK